MIPRTLTINAAHDATELVAKLRAHHYASQQAQAKEADGDQVFIIIIYVQYVCLPSVGSNSSYDRFMYVCMCEQYDDFYNCPPGERSPALQRLGSHERSGAG